MTIDHGWDHVHRNRKAERDAHRSLQLSDEELALRQLFIAYAGKPMGVLRRLNALDARRFEELAEEYGEHQ